MNSNEDVKLEQGGRRCGRRRFWKIPFFVAAVVLIKSALVMLLWNELIPDLFHGPMLTYLQALELTVLAKLLVGFGFRRFGGGGQAAMVDGKRMGTLSPEERVKSCAKTYHNRCGK